MGIADIKRVLATPPAPEKPEKIRRYYPNRELIVVLECGCLESSWLHVHVMGGKDYQYCEQHPESASEWGQRILRNASVAECIRFYEYGESIPRRASASTSSLVRALQGPRTSRARTETAILL